MFKWLLQRAGKPTIVAAIAATTLVLGATAGSLTPPGAVSSTMHSLANVYDSIASATFDSSGIVANQNGSLMGVLKYIEANIGGANLWASNSFGIYETTRNIGILTASPSTALEIVGVASASYMNVSSVSAGYQIDGETVVARTGTNQNIFVGVGAGANMNDIGYEVTALGYNAAHNSRSTYEDTAVGSYALYENTTGRYNTAIGSWAMLHNTVGEDNTAVGASALQGNVTGTDNTAVGWLSQLNNVSGTYNVALGMGTLVYGSNGSYNTAIGTLAGSNASSSNNVFLGSGADVPYYKPGLISNSIALGTNAKVTVSRQLVVGADNGSNYLTEGYFGSGVSASAPLAFRFNGSGGRGSNVAGANLILAGGVSTGTAQGGSLIFQTSPAGSSGTAANAVLERMRIDSTGNVGIGDTSPAYKLEIGTPGDINLASSGAGYRIGGNVVLSNQGYENIWVGSGAGGTGRLGSDNVAVGQYALYNNNATGAYNTAVGERALINNTGGGFNTALGAAAGSANLTGNYNSAFGNNALAFNTAGHFNTALGYDAGYRAKGDNNVFLGKAAGYQETGSNTLWIDNANNASSSAFIYGEFDNSYLSFGASRDFFAGNVGIASSSPSERLSVNGNIRVAGGSLWIGDGSGAFGPSPFGLFPNAIEVATTSHGGTYGVGGGISTVYVMLDSGLGGTGDIGRGGAFSVVSSDGNSALIGLMEGVSGSATHMGSGTVTTLNGGYFFSSNYYLGTVSTMNGVGTQLDNEGGGTVTNGSGFRVYAPYSSTFTNLFGLYIEPQTAGANSWNIYSDGATTRNYFGGYASVAQDLGLSGVTSKLIFDGSTTDANKTSLGVVDPTGSRNFNLSNIITTGTNAGNLIARGTNGFLDDQTISTKLVLNNLFSDGVDGETPLLSVAPATVGAGAGGIIGAGDTFGLAEFIIPYGLTSTTGGEIYGLYVQNSNAYTVANESAVWVVGNWDNVLELEGSTNDSAETHIRILDPTTDGTIFIPRDISGVFALVSSGSQQPTNTGNFELSGLASIAGNLFVYGTASASGNVELSATASISKILVNLLGTQTTSAVCHPNNGQTTAQELVDCDPTAGDYMELYPMDHNVGAGDIVMPDTSKFVISTENDRVPVLIKATDRNQVVGIVSIASKAGDFNSVGHNIRPADNPLPLALNGRVKVRVSAANGPIAIGDPIMLSETPGVGAKATTAGYIVGTALEATAVDGEILVFVRSSYWAPAIPALPDIPQSDGLFAMILGWFRDLLGISFEKGKVQADQLCAGTTCVDSSQLQRLLDMVGGSVPSATPAPPDASSAVTPTPTDSSAPDVTESPSPTPTDTLTPTPSDAPTPTPESTPESVPTDTPVPTP